MTSEQDPSSYDFLKNDIIQTEHGAQIGEVEFIWAKNSKEFLFANSILIHGDEPIIIDPSASFTYCDQLAKRRYVKTVLNTHYHADHRALNHLFLDATYASHEADAEAISSFYEYKKLAAENPDSYYLHWLENIFKQYKIVDCPVTLKLKDGDKLSTGTESVQIISLPGHTPGHIGAYFEKADALFISDIDLTPHGPWYANIASDINAFKSSIKRLKNFECTYYVPSHGERVYDRETFLTKLERFAAQFDKREEKILSLLKEKPLNLIDMCKESIVYKQSSLKDPLMFYFQLQMVCKHIELFEKERKVPRNGDLIYLSS